MSFLAWQTPWRKSPQPPAVAEHQLKTLLQDGLQHPAGSLERRRSLSQLMGMMQATEKVWVAPEDEAAEALLATWFELCQSPDRYLASDDPLAQFNQDVRQKLSGLGGEGCEPRSEQGGK